MRNRLLKKSTKNQENLLIPAHQVRLQNRQEMNFCHEFFPILSFPLANLPNSYISEEIGKEAVQN